MYSDLKHSRHFCVSWLEFDVEKPGGQSWSQYFPAFSPVVSRTHLPGTFAPSVQFCEGDLRAHSPDDGLSWVFFAVDGG